MKHLIETTNPSGLTRVDYDRIVLDSIANDVIVKGGGLTPMAIPTLTSVSQAA